MTRTMAARRGVGRRVVAGALTAAGFAVASVTVAHADPVATPAPTPAPTMTVTGGVQAPGTSATGTSAGSSAAGTAAAGTSSTAASGDVLDQLAEEYSVGAGGGQVSNLLKTCLKLRAMGFRPSKANLEEISTAMNYRPNQLPLIAALKDTIAYQGKIKAQMEILQQYQQQQAGNMMGTGQGSAPGVGAPPAAGAPAAPIAPAAPPSP